MNPRSRREFLSGDIHLIASEAPKFSLISEEAGLPTETAGKFIVNCKDRD